MTSCGMSRSFANLEDSGPCSCKCWRPALGPNAARDAGRRLKKLERAGPLNSISQNCRVAMLFLSSAARCQQPSLHGFCCVVVGTEAIRNFTTSEGGFRLLQPDSLSCSDFKFNLFTVENSLI